MKKHYLFFCLLLSLVTLSCNTNEDLEPNDPRFYESKIEENNLLISPKGVRVEKSLSSFKERLSTAIINEKGEKISFTITGINYLEAANESVAMIDYVGADGYKSTIAYFTVNTVSDGDESGARVMAPTKTYTASCSRTGSCECRTEGTISNGGVTVKCSCEDCELIITEQ